MTMRTTSGNEVQRGVGGVGARGTVRPVERRGSVRPGGRRSGSALPAVRPAVAGGSRRGRVDHPSPAVARRRRLVAVALAVAVALGVGLAVGLVVSSPAEAAGSAVSTVTVVRSGESLQDVARRTAPGADEIEVATRIREANHLATSSVPAGRPLVVPAG